MLVSRSANKRFLDACALNKLAYCIGVGIQIYVQFLQQNKTYGSLQLTVSNPCKTLSRLQSKIRYIVPHCHVVNFNV